MARGRRQAGPPPPSPTPPQRCALCEREVAEITEHHLIPKSHGGLQTVGLCHPCHKTLHAFFSNETLARVYNSLDRLRDAEEIRRYLAWVRKQPDRAIKVYKSGERR